MDIRITARGLILLLNLSQASADDAHCDLQILAAAHGQFGYKAREERCEGTFQQPTALGPSPSNISIISFACVDPATDLTKLPQPSISWDESVGSGVTVRVETLPEIKLRYRLDVRRPATQSRYSWDGTVLQALSIGASELGVLVTGSPKLAGVETPGTVLLARLGGDAAQKDCATAPVLRLRTLERIATVRACASELLPSGERAAEPLFCKSVEGQFSPRASIKIPLDELRARKGMFQLAVTSSQVGRESDMPALFRLNTR